MAVWSAAGDADDAHQSRAAELVLPRQRNQNAHCQWWRDMDCATGSSFKWLS